MNLVRFIENRYQELTLENNEQHKDAFNIRIDSEIKAAHEILTAYRWAMKWVLIPKIFLDFTLMKLKLKKEPEPVILNKMKAERESKKNMNEDNVTPIIQSDSPPSA